MIDPEVTAWCPRGDHADSGLLRCFGGADGVAFGAAPCFGFGGMSVRFGFPGQPQRSDGCIEVETASCSTILVFGLRAASFGLRAASALEWVKGGHSAGHQPVARAGSSWSATRAGARVVTMRTPRLPVDG